MLDILLGNRFPIPKKYNSKRELIYDMFCFELAKRPSFISLDLKRLQTKFNISKNQVIFKAISKIVTANDLLENINMRLD